MTRISKLIRQVALSVATNSVVGTILIAVAIFVAVGARADTRPVFTVVYPTGIFPNDVQNVQAAVDGGGTVLLKAVNAAGVPTAFNFGTAGPLVGQSGAVSLSTDIQIIGEQSGPYGATINGGFAPFRGLVPVKSKISGIDFESPFDEAIVILASTGSEITGNTIHNVVPVKVRVPSGRIITFADGIDFFGQPVITGNVSVSGNVIDGLGAIFSNGIQFDTVGADAAITGNIIRNVNSVNTEQGGGITLVRVQKSVLVANNLIVPGPGQSAAPGILIDGNRTAVYSVIGNQVTGDSPNGDGIDVVGGDPTGTTGTVSAVIAANHITLHNASFSGGIVLFDLVTKNLILGNRIEGGGFLALGVTTYGFQTDTASLNYFVGNDIEGFTSSFADVFFDANAQNNVVIGECRSVVDLGVGNFTTCNGGASDPTTNAPPSAASVALPAAAAGMPGASKQPLPQVLPLIFPNAQPAQ